MQLVGHAPAQVTDLATICVTRYDMRQGERFGRHQHPAHQLVWTHSGVLTAESGDDVWVLPSSRALWIPAHLPHDVWATRAASFHSLYFHPAGCPLEWDEPTIVAISPLLRELVAHLADPELTAPERRRVESVVFDLLHPAPAAAITVRMPTDARALDVARALVADPTDDRTLDEWGRHVGASRRTLARRFVAETDLTFTDWRTRVRVRAAAAHLAAGASTTMAARDAGYQSTSAFIAAFQRLTGRTPGAYYADTPARAG